MINFLSKTEKRFLTIINKQQPIICCLTNFVTVNDCANIILAFGGKPIMTADKSDIKSILSFSKALVLNIGTIKEEEIELFIFAGKIANKLGIPIVLDPCGVQATDFRFKVIEQLMVNIKFAVIKCNVSEATALHKMVKKTSKLLTTSVSMEEIGKDIANTYNCILCISGKIDIITDGIYTEYCRYGNKIMTSITGCGCMLTCVIACFCAVSTDFFNASYFACRIFGKKYKKLLSNHIKVAKTFL